MIALSFKLSNAVPALLSALSKRKALNTPIEPVPRISHHFSVNVHSIHAPSCARVSAQEVATRFADSQPEMSSEIRDMPVSQASYSRIPARHSANSRVTVMEVAAMFDEAHIHRASSIRGAEVKNALSRIVANANEL